MVVPMGERKSPLKREGFVWIMDEHGPAGHGPHMEFLPLYLYTTNTTSFYVTDTGDTHYLVDFIGNVEIQDPSGGHSGKVKVGKLADELIINMGETPS